jgi:hypothetical protein
LRIAENYRSISADQKISRQSTRRSEYPDKKFTVNREIATLCYAKLAMTLLRRMMTAIKERLPGWGTGLDSPVEPENDPASQDDATD